LGKAKGCVGARDRKGDLGKKGGKGEVQQKQPEEGKREGHALLTGKVYTGATKQGEGIKGKRS